MFRYTIVLQHEIMISIEFNNKVFLTYYSIQKVDLHLSTLFIVSLSYV